jgi:hypothetical protein
MLLGSDYSFADRIASDSGTVDFLFKTYLKRLFSSSAWGNLLTGKTDITALKKIMKLKFQNLLKAPTSEQSKKVISSHLENQKLNKAFFESFESLIQQQKKFLFITAQKDGGAESFKTYFQEKYFQPVNRYPHLVDTFLIENANHIYAFSEWQEKLIRKISAYVREELPNTTK